MLRSPVARRYDPSTSHQAGREITESGVRARQVERVIAAVRAHPGHTSAELAELMRWDRYVIARRLSEGEPEHIERAMTTNEAGMEVELKRRCHVTGKMALTWWPAPVQRQLRFTKAAP